MKGSLEECDPEKRREDWESLGRHWFAELIWQDLQSFLFLPSWDLMSKRYGEKKQRVNKYG